jgi:hypothetical protein
VELQVQVVRQELQVRLALQGVAELQAQVV